MRLQSHSCAVSSGGALSCWGSNSIGQVIFVSLREGGGGEGVSGCGCDGFVRSMMLLTTCLLVQLGDGSTTQRGTPVAVAGLSSGVAMVALGAVRLFFDCCAADACVRAAMCVFD